MSETTIEKRTNEFKSRYNTKMSETNYRLPFWMTMLLDRVSDYYMVPKSNLMRLLIDECKNHDVLESPVKFPLEFFNKSSQAGLTLSAEDNEFINKISNDTGLKITKSLQALILTAMPKVVERLEASKSQFQKMNSRLKCVNFYMNSELYDALLYVRDETGNSISLLLKEAIHSYRKRTIEPLPNWKKERRVFVRLLPQEWEKVQILATASEISDKEAAISLLLNHYFANG